MQQIIDLAIESGRKVAVSGRSMVSNTEMARELGYLHAPDNVLITIDEINKYPPEKVVLITTGSQGEPLSALSRMAQASHRQVRVGPMTSSSSRPAQSPAMKRPSPRSSTAC